jgi:hypothetical protein
MPRRVDVDQRWIDERTRLLKAWQEEQGRASDDAETPDDHMLTGVVVVAVVMLILAVVAVRYNAF